MGAPHRWYVVTVTARDALDAQAALSPLVWLKRFTPSAVDRPFGRYHLSLTALPGPGESQARVVFRGSAKTTTVRGLVIHAAIHRRVRGVLLIRSTDADAKADREALERNARLAGVIAHHDGATRMVIVGDVPIWTRTPGGAVRGIHWVNPDTGDVVRPELVVIDDLETRQSASSAEQTTKIRDWLFSDALQTGDQAHPVRTIMLGTPITPTCLIAQAMRRQAPFDTWLEPLIVPLEQDGNPSWPDNYDPTIRDRVPELTMATEYDLQPVPPGALLFKPDRTIWTPTPGPVACWVGVDPAGDGDDATGIAAITRLPPSEVLPFGSLHVVDAMAWNGPASQAPFQLQAFCSRLTAAGHTVHGVLFEANKGPWQFMVREAAQLCAPIPVASEPPVTSKSARALPVTLWQQHGQWSMDVTLKNSTADLELHTFTISEQTVTGHDDVFDAMMWAAGVATQGHTARPIFPDTVAA